MDKEFNLEKPPEKVSTITKKEFLDRIYRGESFPQDKRFIDIENGGSFKYLNLSDIIGYAKENDKRFYPIVEINNEIVGLAELQVNPNDEKNLWLKFISVDKKYEGKGYGRKIADEMFRFAMENGYSLKSSTYSPEGRLKLKKIFSELAQKYPINFEDSVY